MLKRHLPLALLITASAVSFMGCALPTETSHLKLQNSSVDHDPSHAAVVAVIHRSQFCSGVALSTTLVLTAQHCVDLSRSDCGVAINGQSPSACFYDSDYIQGDYSEKNAHHDIVALSFEAQSGTVSGDRSTGKSQKNSDLFCAHSCRFWEYYEYAFCW